MYVSQDCISTCIYYASWDGTHSIYSRDAYVSQDAQTMHLETLKLQHFYSRCTVYAYRDSYKEWEWFSRCIPPQDALINNASRYTYKELI